MIRPLAAAVHFVLTVAPFAVLAPAAAGDSPTPMAKTAPGARPAGQTGQGTEHARAIKDGDSDAHAARNGNDVPEPPLLILTLVGLGLLAMTVRHHTRQRSQAS